MPIASGQAGGPGVIAQPRRWTADVGGPRGKPIRSQPLALANTTVAGTTRDATGLALGGCQVDLFLAANDQLLASQVSDGAGAFRFDNPGSGPFYLLAYLPGSPNRFGTSDQNLNAV